MRNRTLYFVSVVLPKNLPAFPQLSVPTVFHACDFYFLSQETEPTLALTIQ